MANNSVGVNICEEGFGIIIDIDSDKYEMIVDKKKMIWKYSLL